MEKFADIIQDSLCVGQVIPGSDEQVILFVQMKSGVALDQKTEILLRNSIANALSRKHVPERIYAIPKVPYNVNGKKLEIAVKRVVSGVAIDSKLRTTLVNPGDLDIFQKYSYRPDLKANL